MSQVTNPNDLDPRQLVRWLGTDGARHGLLTSRKITVDVLKLAAEKLGVKLRDKATKEQWVDAILEASSKRIDKKLEDLFSMDRQALLSYFEEIEVEVPEILDLLKQLDLQPRRESRRSLLEFAAQELSETGRFIRISGNYSTEETPVKSPRALTKKVHSSKSASL